MYQYANGRTNNMRCVLKKHSFRNLCVLCIILYAFMRPFIALFCLRWVCTAQRTLIYSVLNVWEQRGFDDKYCIYATTKKKTFVLINNKIVGNNIVASQRWGCCCCWHRTFGRWCSQWVALVQNANNRHQPFSYIIINWANQINVERMPSLCLCVWCIRALYMRRGEQYTSDIVHHGAPRAPCWFFFSLTLENDVHNFKRMNIQ